MRLHLPGEWNRNRFIIIVSLVSIVLGTVVLTLNNWTMALWLRGIIDSIGLILITGGLIAWILKTQSAIKDASAALQWVRQILLLVACAILVAGTAIGVVTDNSNLPVILNVSGVIVALLQWLFSPPVVNSESLPTPTSTSDGPRNIAGPPPPTNFKGIQSRKELTREIYDKLLQPDTTVIALTGITGVGKSTLAALVAKYAEEQIRRQQGPFSAKPIWLAIDPITTIRDVIGTLLEIQGKAVPDLDKMTHQAQAEALISALDGDTTNLVILDQFDNILDTRTGLVKEEHPGLRAWLDVIASKQCKSRILLTSCILPQGSGKFLPMFDYEIPVNCLNSDEGVDFLKQRGLQASEKDLLTAVRRCGGHPFALMLLESLLHEDRSLSLADLLRDLRYKDLWQGKIVGKLNQDIQRLDSVQADLLLAFSIYREPMPIAAVWTLMDSRRRSRSDLDVLLAHHLLEANGGGYYHVHIIATIIINYLQNHQDGKEEQDDQGNTQRKYVKNMQKKHMKAARHYLRQRRAPHGRRRDRNDIQPLIEAIWHYCQARQWTQAYTLAQREQVFDDLRNWGEKETLLELCELLLYSEMCKPDSPPAKLLRTYQENIYKEWENA